MSSTDRQRGTLFGLAVGDALGAAVEFQSPGSFPKVTGYRSGGPHCLAPGEWTDDSSTAIALADSIASVGWDLNDQARRYVAWWQKGEYSVNDRCFDIGITTRSALSRFLKSGDAKTSGDPSEQASGNGSIMRLAPVPIHYASLFPNRLDELVRYLIESSLPTHASPQCSSACAYMGLMICGLIHRIDRDEVLAAEWEPLQRLRQVHTLHPAVAEVAAGSFRCKKPPEIVGSGYVVKSLEAALWAFHDAKDFREAVLRAVNLGNDADTTGAVCGQLAGAYWGELGIPAEWREGLARQEMIETALVGLLAQPTSAAMKIGPGALSIRKPAKEHNKEAASAPVITTAQPQNPLPKIHPERFPAKPVFVSSNEANRKMNDLAISNALELATKADLRGLESMELPPSPKLKSWHHQLVRELTHQIKVSPEKVSGETYKIASSDAKPPTSSSYWVVPGLFLAGAYPGNSDLAKHRKKIQDILGSGVRVIISLMEKNETNHQGKPFVPYEDLAKTFCPDAECRRFAIRDMTAPTTDEMTTILDTIDRFLATNRPVYLHCWGGVGRTGTVVACWLLRHGFAVPQNVLYLLAELRKQDRERGTWLAPQSEEQKDLVIAWSPEAGPIVEGDDTQGERHWRKDNYWTNALETYHRLRESGQTQMILDLAAIERLAFNGDGPAYKLMHAMVSVWQQEAWDGFRGAPRVVLAMLARLEELSREHT